MARYVQHISGQGARWQLTCEQWPGDWKVHKDIDLQNGFYYLPKAEYHEVTPPAQWVDVTDECATFNGEPWHKGSRVLAHEGYRFRKISFPGVAVAFLVEKLVKE